MRERLVDETALIRGGWFIEMTNVLALAERPGRVSAAQSDGFVAGLLRLGIKRNDQAPGRAFRNLLALCRTYQLTSYDAVYPIWQPAVGDLGPGPA